MGVKNVWGEVRVEVEGRGGGAGWEEEEAAAAERREWEGAVVVVEEEEEGRGVVEVRGREKFMDG